MARQPDGARIIQSCADDDAEPVPSRRNGRVRSDLALARHRAGYDRRHGQAATLCCFRPNFEEGRGMSLIIDCHGHYTVLPQGHDAWREEQKAAYKGGTDRKSDGTGKSVYVRVDLGGRRNIKKKQHDTT